MRRSLCTVLGIYLVLALACGVTNPLFEAPDEQHHYFAARYIARTGWLPVATEHTLYRQEAAQPPLYYLLSALIIAPIDSSPNEPSLWVNPYVRLGDFGSVININAFIHTQQEKWPWQGFALAAHLLRVLSALFGLGTLACVHASGRLLWPAAPERALLATALVAFLPQFIFVHSAITNDTLVILLCSAAVLQSIRVSLQGSTTSRLLALGLTIGLAALTKTTGLLLLAFTLFLVGVLMARRGNWRRVAGSVGLIAVPVALLTGWVFWRNWVLYSDLFGASVFVELGGGDRHYTIRQALGDLNRVWPSSIAVFGWMNLVGPTWVYAVWNGLVASTTLGMAVKGFRGLPIGRGRNRGQDSFLMRSPEAHPWLLAGLLAMWPLLVFAAWLIFSMRTPADQGRLLFPALLPVSLALSYGICQWGRRWVPPVASMLALGTSVYCIAVLLPRTYASPVAVDEASIPEQATRFHHSVGLGLELMAGQVHTSSAHPGGSVALTLYWRAREKASAAAVIATRVLGRAWEPIGGLPDSYHGGGLYPSTLWPPDTVIREQYQLHLDDGISVPTLGRIDVHLAGQEEYLEIGSVKVVPRKWPRPSDDIVAELGEGISLTQATLGTGKASRGASVAVNLRWQISHRPEKDLITFVHLGDPTEPPAVQADGPALGGDYPPRLWEADEVFDDRYVLQLPADISPGRYPVHVGLYDPQTGERVPLSIAGIRQPSDALLVGWLTIE